MTFAWKHGCRCQRNSRHPSRIVKSGFRTRCRTEWVQEHPTLNVNEQAIIPWQGRIVSEMPAGRHGHPQTLLTSVRFHAHRECLSGSRSYPTTEPAANFWLKKFWRDFGADAWNGKGERMEAVDRPVEHPKPPVRNTPFEALPLPFEAPSPPSKPPPSPLRSMPSEKTPSEPFMKLRRGCKAPLLKGLRPYSC